MKENMKNMLVDLAMILKKYTTPDCACTIDGDQDGSVTVFCDGESVYFNSMIGIPEIAAELDRDENPYRKVLVASSIDLVQVVVHMNDFVVNPKLCYSWNPKGVSADSGYLSFDLQCIDWNGKKCLLACIRKHGFMELVVNKVRIDVDPNEKRAVRFKVNAEHGIEVDYFG